MYCGAINVGNMISAIAKFTKKIVDGNSEEVKK